MYPPRFVVFLDMRTAIQRVEYSVSWYVLHYTRYQYSMFCQKFLFVQVCCHKKLRVCNGTSKDKIY